MKATHQYIERASGQVCDETLYADRLVRWMYHPLREYAPMMFNALTGPRVSSWLGTINYDLDRVSRASGQDAFLEKCGVDLSECLDDPATLNTPRKIFERKIRYWQCRPMENMVESVVSTADARLVVGSLVETDTLFLKDKFFSLVELLGSDKPAWLQRFDQGDFAVLRLTPDKYHFNHVPVSGEIRDIYELEGRYHACNPGAVVAEVTPYSKNRRLVTIIDTDVNGGSQVGLVAMIEVVALMIGDIHSCYSSNPQGYEPVIEQRIGVRLERGQPKSLFRPGSSTDVLLFEPGRIRFCPDLLENQQRQGISSRFSLGFGRPLVETDVPVRSTIALSRVATSARQGDV
ncbi:phosphatidylserine decarboxylase [uncultured Desulfuromonas sp.]|uniref:phosphatidylserine decarboxylase n=1 Tax=uncultured Desulfuromonas sp. TaxID=181013 RepID=UPI002AAA6425|nr:phosphatidylserine decarboxylase [uncultured Desulfuromonas sp.]